MSGLNNTAADYGYAEPAEQPVSSKYPPEYAEYWMQTYSGIQFRPYAPTPEMVSLIDIFHVIPKLERYNCHLDHSYSVAQHCVYTSYIVPQEFAFAALMHDVVEVWMGDLPAPVKWGMPQFSELEDYIFEQAVAPKFGIEFPLPKAVKRADFAKLCYEKSAIVRDFGHIWGCEDHPVPKLAERIPNFGVLPDGTMARTTERGMPLLTTDQARSLFMDRFFELRPDLREGWNAELVAHVMRHEHNVTASYRG
jgi:uncharacterized protein